MKTFWDVKNNIWKLFLMQGIRWFLLFVPVIVLFYQSRGLSMQQVLLLQAAFSVTVILMEIPTGYFADSVGRKFSIFLGAVFWMLGWLTYSLSEVFIYFILAEIVLAVGSSLISGADSALLFDTLAELGRKEEYKNKQGKMIAIWNFSEATASIIGGMIAVISLKFPLYIQTGTAFLLIPLALTLKEPARKILDLSEGRVKTILLTIKYALHEHTELKWLVIYSGLISSMSMLFLWFIQPRLALAGLPIAWFGWIWAGLQLTAGVFASQAEWIEARLGRKHILMLLGPVAAVSFILFALTPGLWIIVVMVIPYIVRGLNIPVLQDYINRITDESKRATILSLSSFVMRILFIIIGPIIGLMNDRISFEFAFSFAGVIFLTLSIITLTRLHKFKLL